MRRLFTPWKSAVIWPADSQQLRKAKKLHKARGIQFLIKPQSVEVYVLKCDTTLSGCELGRGDPVAERAGAGAC